MEENNKFNFAGGALVYYFAAVIIVVVIAFVVFKNKSQDESKELEPQADIVATDDITTFQGDQETVEVSVPDIGINHLEAEPKETSEPNLKDYFVKSRLVKGNEGQYKFSDYSEDIDRLVDDCHYFDFYHFVSEYLGNNTKIFYDRFVGDGSIHLTAEQSPFGNSTTILQDDLGWVLRIIVDQENTVSALDEAKNYIDLCTLMKNNGSFYTYIVVCRNGVYYSGNYTGKMRPEDMVFNMSNKFNTEGSDEDSFLFIVEKDALKSLLKMAEKGALLSDENPFEAIGDEWEELESYSLFVKKDDTEG